MKTRGLVFFVFLTVAAITLAAPSGTYALPGKWRVIDDDDWCRDGWDRHRARVCEVREMIVDDGWKTVAVDARANGGIEVEGWDEDYIRIQAKVSASARDDGDAREILEDVEIEVGRRVIRADGPKLRGRGRSWSVSYRLMVPRRTNLELQTLNGGIAIRDVEGEIEADATNGGMNLTRLAGDVRVHTTNGGLKVKLDGDGWRGRGLDANTTNGGVELLVPRGYSAELVTGTVNGSLKVDFPVTIKGKIHKRLRATLGDGGPTVRVTTTNGSVKLKRR